MRELRIQTDTDYHGKMQMDYWSPAFAFLRSLQRNIADSLQFTARSFTSIVPFIQEAPITGFANKSGDFVATGPEKLYSHKAEIPSFKRVIVGIADILSTIHPNHVLVAATFVAAFFILYIKMRYPFWNQVPALHAYDWHRRFLYSEKPYIIHRVPKKTKYYKGYPLIQTCKFGDLTVEKQTELVKLLQNHYFPSDRVFCSLKLPDLAAQLTGSIVSTRNTVTEDISCMNGTIDVRDCVVNSGMNGTIDAPALIGDRVVNCIIDNKCADSEKRIERTRVSTDINGFISSRQVQISASLLHGSSNRYIVAEPAEYMDYMCFSRTLMATPLVARETFHVHEYNQRSLLRPANAITVFKKEVELCDALVPLVKYDSLTFYLRHQIKPAALPTNWQIVRIQKEHQSHLHDWYIKVASLKDLAGFRVSVSAEIGDLIGLLQTNQLFAYVLRGPDPVISSKLDVVYAMYFFRNAHMKYEDLEGGDTVHCVAAFLNTADFELCFQGFLWALRFVIKDFPDRPKMLMMDDLGHLRPIVSRLKGSHDIVLKTPCAYYLTNYVVPRSPFLPEEVNILV